MTLTPEDIDRVVSAALAEDVGSGDATTLALVPADARCRAELLLEEPGVVCASGRSGRGSVRSTRRCRSRRGSRKATAVSSVPAFLAVVEGPARAILSGERVALNLLGRLCGIASLTRRFVS
jgi:nicotinate-nucleotide pyrophosphorylase (carboxylating)